MMVGTLTDQEHQVVADAVHPDVEILSSTVARLYFSTRNEWAYQDKVGAVVLARSGRYDFSFQLIDLANPRVVWTCPITSPDIQYIQDRPFFHTFINKQDHCITAFSFADESEAKMFADRVNQRSSSVPPPVAPRLPPPLPAKPTSKPPPPPRVIVANVRGSGGSITPPASPPPFIKVPAAPVFAAVTELRALETTPKTNKKEKKKRESRGFFGTGRKKTETAKKRDSVLDKSMISAPTDFKHVSHVGYNPKTGFSVDNIPLEWNAIFAKAGITADQLADRKTAKFLQKFMKQATAPDIPQRRPPPPPPSRRSSVDVTTPPPHHAPIIPSKTGPPVLPAKPGTTNGVSGIPPPPPPPPPPPMSFNVPPPPMFASPPPPTLLAPSPPPRVSAPQGDVRSSLLASIRESGGLKSLKGNDVPTLSVSTKSGDDIANQLKNALMQRREHIGGSDDDETDDDEWDD